MPSTPITGLLLTDLLATARADGVAFIHAAAIIQIPNAILLLHRGDGDDFSPYRWDLPAGYLIQPRDQLDDVIKHVVTHAAGYDLAEITGYTGHHDEADCHGRALKRTFAFTVNITDPAHTHRDTRQGHQWLLTWRNPLHFPAGTTATARHLIHAALERPAPATCPGGPEPAIADALRAGADGIYPLEAACDLLLNTLWPHRNDFTRFIHTGTSITDGTTELAHIDWPAAIAARDTGHLPCSGSENRILRLAASIAAGVPVDLREALSGLDQTNTNLVVRAVRHANGERPAHW